MCLETLENNIAEFWAAKSWLELEKTPSLNRRRKEQLKGLKNTKLEANFPPSGRPEPSGNQLFHLESCEPFWVFLEVYPLYGASNLFLNILNTTINIPKHS